MSGLGNDENDLFSQEFVGRSTALRFIDELLVASNALDHASLVAQYTR